MAETDARDAATTEDPGVDPRRDVILLHGWGCPPSYWSRLERALEASRPILRYVAPGYDGEAVTEWSFTLCARKLAQLIESRQRWPVTLIAHSMGVFVAGELLRRRSDLVADVVMLGIVPTPPAAHGVNPAVEELVSVGRMSDAALQDCLEGWFGSDFTTEDHLDDALRNVPGDVLLASAFACRNAPEGAWDGVDCPVHVISGGDDRTRPEAEILAFVAARPGARRLSVVPGAGHMAMWTHATEVAKLCDTVR